MHSKLGFILSLFITQTTLFAQTGYDMKKVLQTAKRDNKVLKTEAMSIDVSASDVVTAKLRPNLTLNNMDLVFAESRYYAPNTVSVSPYNRQVWWQLTKQFQLPSQRKNKINLANKNVTITEANYLNFERNLLTEVAMSWLQVWLSQKKFETAQMAKNNWDTLVIINANRLKNHVITTTDYDRIALTASQYNLLSQTAQQEYHNKINNLKFLLAVEGDITISSEDNLEWTALASVDQLMADAIDHRSDINVYKNTIEAMKSNVSLQKSLAYPQPELGVIYNPQNSVPYLGIYINVDLPFFDRNQGEIRKSKIVESKAEQELIMLKQKIKTEITNAYAIYRQYQQNVISLKKMKEQSHIILENVKYSYMKGGTTLIDFLEAQRTWYDSQQNYYEAVYQHKVSYIELLYSTGLIDQIAQ